MNRDVFYIGGPDEAKHKAEWERLKRAHRALDLSRPHKVVIELYYPPSTDEQKKFYRVWIGIVAKDTGNDQDDIHDVVKRKYCPWKTVYIGGVETQVQSTKHLNTVEMAEYMNKVEAWAARELSITLPPPKRQSKES